MMLAMALSLFTQHIAVHPVSCSSPSYISCRVQSTYVPEIRRTHVVIYQMTPDGRETQTAFSGTPRGNIVTVDRVGSPGHQYDTQGTCTLSGRELSCQTPQRSFRGTIR